MSNPANVTILEGRLLSAPKVFTNKDGSETRLYTLAVEDNFRSGSDRQAQTQRVPFEVFVPAKGIQDTSWNRIGEGDRISLMGHVVCQPYEKNGETIYPAPKIVADGFPNFLEPRSVTEKRAAEKALKHANTGTVPAQDVPQDPEATGQDHIAELEAQLAAARAMQSV